MCVPAPRPTRRRAVLPALGHAQAEADHLCQLGRLQIDRLGVIGLDQLLRKGIEQEAGGLCPAVGKRLPQAGNRLHDAAVRPGRRVGRW